MSDEESKKNIIARIFLELDDIMAQDAILWAAKKELLTDSDHDLQELTKIIVHETAASEFYTKVLTCLTKITKEINEGTI